MASAEGSPPETAAACLPPPITFKMVAAEASVVSRSGVCTGELVQDYRPSLGASSRLQPHKKVGNRKLIVPYRGKERSPAQESPKG